MLFDWFGRRSLAAAIENDRIVFLKLDFQHRTLVWLFGDDRFLHVGIEIQDADDAAVASRSAAKPVQEMPREYTVLRALADVGRVASARRRNYHSTRARLQLVEIAVRETDRELIRVSQVARFADPTGVAAIEHDGQPPGLIVRSASVNSVPDADAKSTCTAGAKTRGQSDMRCASRSTSPTLPRCFTTPLGRVQPFTIPNGLGSRGLPSSLAKKYLRSRGKSVPRQGDRLAIARCERRFTMLSPNGTTLQVDQVTHTEAFADFSQLWAAGREESAEQSIPAKLLDLNLPTLGATAQPHENPGQLRRDRSLSFAEKPPGVVDQLDSRKLLEPVLQPLPAVVVSFTQQERTADASRHAVILAGKGHINQLRSSDRHA